MMWSEVLPVKAFSVDNILQVKAKASVYLIGGVLHDYFSSSNAQADDA